MDRYVVPAYGPDEGALRVALLAGTQLAEKYDCSATILVPALKHAEDTILSKVLDPRLVKNLVKGKTCKLDDIPTVMRSTRTINPFAERGVIVCLWGAQDALDKVDQSPRAQAAVLLEWTRDNTRTWVEKWNPVLLDVKDA